MDFGDVRSLVNTTDDAEREKAWPVLIKAMKKALKKREDEVSDVWLPYVLQALERWPDHLRVAPRDWLNATIRGERVGVLMALVTAVDATNMTNPRFQKMCTRSDFTWVRHLNFSGSNFKLASARALGGASAFENLHSLSFHHSKLGSIKIRAFMVNPFVNNLTSLRMSSCGIRGGDLAAMFKLGDFTSLERLDLAMNQSMDSPCIHALVDADLPSLRHLDLSNSWTHAEDLDVLLGAAWLPTLDSLDLARSIASTYVRRSNVSYVDQLKRLNIEENIRQRVLDSGLRPEVAAAAARTIQ